MSNKVNSKKTSKQEDTLEKKFKDERVKRLQKLCDAILANLKNVDVQPIKNALYSSTCENKKWYFEVHGLIIGVSKDKTRVPIGVPLRVRIDFNVVVDIKKWNSQLDPYDNYFFSFTIFGNDDAKDYSVSWHIDRDIKDDNKREPHPLYHIHFSDGRNILKKDQNTEYSWGNSINMNVPRLVHYPMNLVLGLLFIVANFRDKKEYEALKNDIRMIRLFNDAKDHLIAPYINTFADIWEKSWMPNKNNYSYKDLCPYFL